MKKVVIFLLLIILIPSVMSLTSQEWINKHNFNPNNPVFVGSQISMNVTDGQGNIVPRNPMVGENIYFEINEEGIYNIVYIFDDDFNLIGNYSLNGNSFFGYKMWTHKVANTSKISTAGWKPQDYHVIIYTFKYDYPNNKYYDNSWKVYTFTLNQSPQSIQKQIGPISNPNISCNNTFPNKLTQGTYTLCNQNYTLSQNLEIYDNVSLDCNGALLEKTKNTQIQIWLLRNNITLKNCVFNVELYASNENSNINILNNDFYKFNAFTLLSISNSTIKNNLFFHIWFTSNTVSSTAPKTGNNLIENNFIHVSTLQESNNNIITNNEINQISISYSSKNNLSNNKILADNTLVSTSNTFNMLLTASSQNIIEHNIFDGKNLVSPFSRKVTGLVIGVLGGENNVLARNTFENYEQGVYMATYGGNNTLVNNNFINNNIHIIDNNDHINYYNGNYYSGGGYSCLINGYTCSNSYDIMDDLQSTIMNEDQQPSAIKNK